MSIAETHKGNTFTLKIPEIDTERLRLRLPSEADFKAEVTFYDSDRSDGVGGRRAPDQVWRHLAAMIGHWVLRGYGLWAIEEKATGVYCGRVGLYCPDGWPEPEIGWTLMAHAEGRGIAYEAALAARDYAYGTLGWTTAISLIGPGNTRSAGWPASRSERRAVSNPAGGATSRETRR